MSDKRDSLRDEELDSPFHTIAGVAIILCIVAFVGFARSRQPAETPPAPIPVTQNAPAPAVERPKPIEAAKLMQQPQSLSSVAPKDLINETGIQVELPFGRDAAERCKQSCSSQVLCETNCLRLMSGEFARRILPADPDVAATAQKSAESCKKFSAVPGVSPEERQNLAELLSPPEFFERGPLIDRSTKASSLFGRIKSDAQHPTPLGEGLCLMEAALATELAVADAASNKDSFSEMFYRHLEQEFLSRIDAIKEKMTAEANA